MRKLIVPILLTMSSAVVACGSDETLPVDDKTAYEDATKLLSEKVALISLYQPHLDLPKPQKYDPSKRTDLNRACAHAANEIRHAANGARQRLGRSTNASIKELAGAFAEVSKICADLEGNPEELAKCKDAVNVLDGKLQDHASKASKAGATAKFPRVAPEFVTDRARESIKLFLQAKGPGPQEKKYLDSRRDPKAAPADITMGCDAAAQEAQVTMDLMAKSGNEDVRKVSAHHKAAVDGQCNRVKDSASLLGGLQTCKEREDDVKKDEELQAECKLACSKVKGRIDDGVRAAAFEPMGELYEYVCADEGILAKIK